VAVDASPTSTTSSATASAVAASAARPLPPQALGGAAVVGALLVISMTASGSGVLLSIIISYCVWATAGLSWNIISGFGGQLSFGHAAFFGLGAYTMAIMSTRMGVSPWIGLLVGGCVASILAILIGLPTFRLQGPYFALGTWAIAQVCYVIAVYWVDFTGGNDGIYLSSEMGWKVMLWSDLKPFALVAIGLLSITIAVVIAVRRSKLGYLLLAIRDDQVAAAAVGIWPLRAKLAGLAISAFLTAAAGALLGRYLSVVAPIDFLSVHVSATILLVTYIGGLATVGGPLVGAMLIIPLQQWLQLKFGSVTTSLQFQIGLGSLLVLIAIVLPQGIWGGVLDLARHGNSLAMNHRNRRASRATDQGQSR
jgi:branched-chain amino acid transport system permease protein